VRGYEGHHRNTVNGNDIESAANPNNIEFLTETEHAARHAAVGGTNVPISGMPLLDRTVGGAVAQPVREADVPLTASILAAAGGVLASPELEEWMNITSLNPLDAGEAQ
jgi:hypothetical protein